MDHVIVSEKAKTIRAIARQALKKNWFKTAVAMGIFCLLTVVVSQIVGYFFNYNYETTINEVTESVTLDYGSGIYEFVLLGAFTLGISTFFINFLRTKQSDYSLIFEGFSNFGKSFFLNFVISLKVFLWALLFVVPGIIAALRYSQAFNVLVDHPEYRVSQCINESKMLMYGNKAKLFGLNLSFIGWSIIGLIPFSVFNSLYIQFNWDINFWELLVISCVVYIPMLFVTSYIQTANIVFYDLVTGKLQPVKDEQ